MEDHLLYNISFDIAGLAVIICVLVIHISTYRFESPNNRAFRHFLYCSVFNGVMSITTALTISYIHSVPDTLNMILNVAYQISAFGTAYLGMNYIFTCVGLHSRVGQLFDLAAGVFYCFILTINSGSNVMFKFENHTYVKGPLFQLSYFISLFFLFHAAFVMIRHRDRFTSRQFFLNAFYIIIPCCFAVVQLNHGDILLTYFAGTLAALFMVFSLETADFLTLQKAMEELKEARNAEMQANRAKSDFLARMSHEIRTPINGILGMNSMILKECGDGDILEYAESIDAAGHGLLSLINDILDLSKIESGKMELVLISYHLSSVINDCYHMVAQQAKEKGLYLNTEIDPSLPYRLYGDEVRVRQIVINLLNNAVKYTDRGGVTFSVGGSEYIKDGKRYLNLELSVSDTGIGIREEDQEKLFTAFSRADLERNRNIEGTGLGLRITAQLVDLMEGEIELHSEYGKGSVFTVRIPQLIQGHEVVGNLDVAAAAEERAAKQEKKVFYAPDLRLLVVDDVELNLKVVCGFLKESKIKIDLARGGLQCIQQCMNNRYDLILLDHMMPEMDGLETFRKMREMEHNLNRDTPVIMMTANAIVGAREEYLEMGFSDYLSKPVMEADLLRIIVKNAPPSLIHWELVEPEPKAPAHPALGQDHTDGGWLDRLSFLDTKSALLFCSGNPDFYREILDTFIAENRMGDIQKYFTMEDWKNYAVQVHALKSSARLIGASALSETARQLEMAAKAEAVDELRANHGKCMMAYGETRQKLAMALMH